MKILITGANSYVGTHVGDWLMKAGHHVDTIDMMGDAWKTVDFSPYDTLFHVAGIAHVDAKKSMRDLYYRVNCDLAYEVAQKAKAAHVAQFIFMSSMIVYQESQSLKPLIIQTQTSPKPNGFYGDSKLQAEYRLAGLDDDAFRICILRPPMIYGPEQTRGNFPRLMALARRIPVFPKWNNQRSMLYIDNLSEFVRQAVERQLRGTYFPQNAQLANTLHLVQYFAQAYHHPLWVTPLFNPLLRLCSPWIKPINKLFATYYYDPCMSVYDFEYAIVSLEDSLKRMMEQ